MELFRITALLFSVAVATTGCEYTTGEPSIFVGQPVLPGEEPGNLIQGVLWEPYLEWSLTLDNYEGNPFDLPARTVFTHSETGEQITTWMFYDGGDIWKFRFTGTKIGLWTFESFSEVDSLNGYKGSVIIESNPDMKSRGFSMANGNKFVRQGPAQDDFEPFIPNAWLNYREWGNQSRDGWTSISQTFADSNMVGAFLDDAYTHGMNGIQAIIANQWFTKDVATWNDIDNENPDPETFYALEKAILQAHRRGMFIHIWAWGDEQRQWTPTGLTGGINGEADRRIQRYIAARLGPLPGWSMGFGFDLNEWTNTDEVTDWVDYMQEKAGWPRLLGARGERNFTTPSNATYYSHDQRLTDNFYQGSLKLLNDAENRPVWLTRRFGWMRDNVWDMTTSRRALWQFAMAGGIGAIWGHYPPASSASGEGNYQKEQLSTYRDFWKDHLLLDLEPDNDLSEGALVLRRQMSHFIFYQEDAGNIHMDLSAIEGSFPAVAVDTKGSNKEIDLGNLTPGVHNWNPPYQSDWVISIGY